MLHPGFDLKHISETIGAGVFATQFIPKGTIVWTQCSLDICLSLPKLRTFSVNYYEEIGKYSFVNAEGVCVLAWDSAKYQNHCCNPSCLDIGALQLTLAIRDIAIGEELTCDYGALNICEPMECCCGIEECRGLIQQSDKFNYYPKWEQAFIDCLPHIDKVPQPLYPLVAKRQLLANIIAGKQALPPFQKFCCSEETIKAIKEVLNLKG